MATTGTFRYQFDCSNAVTSADISNNLPITNISNSITVTNIGVTQTPSTNTYTIDIGYSYISITGTDGVTFANVLDYYKNTTGSGVSNLQILDLDNIPLSSSGNQLRNLTTLTQFTSGQHSSATILYRMFAGCINLISATFDTNFNTSSVTSMEAMFSGCTSLTSLDVSNFNTSSVTSMEAMFTGCTSLTSLDVSNFNTSSVTSMESMFNNCSSLTTLNISYFDTSNVVAMNRMFQACTSLTAIDLSNFNTSNVTNMNAMFAMAQSEQLTPLLDSSLNTITFGQYFDPSGVTGMQYMFYNCNQLTTVQHKDSDNNIIQGIDNWNTSNVTNMTSMFENTSILYTIGDVYNGWNVANVGSNHANFSLNSSLTNIPNFTDSQLDISGNWFLRQSGSDVEYSSSVSGPWTTAVWPIALINTDSPSSTLNVTLVTDLSLNALTQYFIMGSDKITIDGSNHIVTVNVASYLGLIQNGTVDTSGNSDITIQNLGVLSTYSVAQAGGWIGQQYFGQNATDNNVINCYSTGTIGPAGGGIFGSYSSSQATNCYSTGTIGEFAGGIFGQSSDASASATNCYSTGPIGTSAGGIFGPNSSGSATNCYCTGGTNIGGASQTYCYSTNGSANWLDASANDALDFSGNPWTDIDLNSDTVPYLLSAFTNTLYDPYSETNAIDSGDSLLTDCSFSIVSVNDENPSLYSGITIDSNTGDISFNSVSYGTTYVVNVLARNANDGYSFGTFTNIISNICFPAGTPIVTNQGIIAINKINPAIHTIRNKKIVAITKTVSPDKYLVRFEKDALGANLPCEATTMTQNHMLFYKGKMIKAKEFLKTHNESVTKVPYNGQVLYNVLMEEHDKMVVNNLICETLHPENYVAKMYHAFKILTPKQRVELIQKVNKEIIKRDIFSSTFGKGCNEVRAKNENEVRAKNGDKVRIQLTL